MLRLQQRGSRKSTKVYIVCGGEEYERLRPLSYPDTDLLLLMFSFGSPESFDNCSSKWAPELKQFCPGVPIILVGGKKVTRKLINQFKYYYEPKL